MEIVDNISAEIVDSTSAIKGLKEAREVVMLAQTITAVASAAATSPAPAQAIAAEVTLGYVSQMLTEVVETLDVASLHLEKALQSVPGASTAGLGKH
jgi:hypothetical protein